MPFQLHPLVCARQCSISTSLLVPPGSEASLAPSRGFPRHAEGPVGAQSGDLTQDTQH